MPFELPFQELIARYKIDPDFRTLCHQDEHRALWDAKCGDINYWKEIVKPLVAIVEPPDPLPNFHSLTLIIGYYYYLEACHHFIQASKNKTSIDEALELFKIGWQEHQSTHCLTYLIFILRSKVENSKENNTALAIAQEYFGPTRNNSTHPLEIGKILDFLGIGAEIISTYPLQSALQCTQLCITLAIHANVTIKNYYYRYAMHCLTFAKYFFKDEELMQAFTVSIDSFNLHLVERFKNIETMITGLTEKLNAPVPQLHLNKFVGNPLEKPYSCHDQVKADIDRFKETYLSAISAVHNDEENHIISTVSTSSLST